MEIGRFVFPVRLKPDEGGYVVSFRDLPEALTQGDDELDALVEAADCLDEAIAGRIIRGDDIPLPSRPRRGERLTVVIDRRRELKPGLMHGRLRQLGLTLDDIH